MDASEVLLHLLIGFLCQEVDVLFSNQELPAVAQRNLQAVGAADGLHITGKVIIWTALSSRTVSHEQRHTGGLEVLTLGSLNAFRTVPSSAASKRRPVFNRHREHQTSVFYFLYPEVSNEV